MEIKMHHLGLTRGWFVLDSWLVIDSCMLLARETAKTCRCLYMLVITVAIWPREVVSSREFILCAVGTFWAMSLVGIYPGRASTMGTHNLALKLSLAIIG